ncbi:ATP-dependent zinc metalloprotease FTSH 11, chloroplastic/mitochondrial-like, partial [Mangifera indica]|uniref:ATP-dependent zinc metalloprotease FTSH 11, chloroplastic/mitochondrial-like n=1 Tax=Mangifera indica TaxID=29780 RepID=UPI001CFC1838
MALAAKLSWTICHLDVKSAFLNGILDEDIFVEQREGFKVPGKEQNVYKLHKTLYGLKQAPKACPNESTLYIKRLGNEVKLIVSLFMQSPSNAHMVAAKRILRHIKGTSTYGLWFSKQENNKLVGFSDSDWAGSVEDAKNTFGYCFSFGSAVFCWNSKKQKAIAQSSVEAKYIAAIWLRKLLKDLGHVQDESVVLFVDNKTVIAIVKNPVHHGRTKHINVKFHAIQENVKTFKDVKGCDDAKQELVEVVEYLKNPSKFTRLGGKLPKGILLTGAPGTGKTLLAKAIAGEAGVPFFYRAGSEFEEMFVGVGARRVRSLFQAAKKKAPCIIFIDEIDAVGSTRKQWEGHTKKTLHQLLVEMDGFEQNAGIILMAATNLPDILDPALTRPGRFDRNIVVPNPDVRGRQEILELYLQDKPLAEDVDIKSIARGTPGFNGADLANLVNIAAIKAAVEGLEKITATELGYAKDRILLGTERKTMFISEESKKLTAYHESGHAIVAFNTEGAHPIHKATIMPRGSALGMVTQLPSSDETSVSKKQLLARLDVCMGGRAAEELIFGQDHVTTGASSDLHTAIELAQYMV